MPFDPGGLRDAFEAQGELGFTYWTYATRDRLAEVLAPGYFARLDERGRLGALILVGIQPRRSSGPWDRGQPETRRVLLMVTAVRRGGTVAVRVVQDYGTIADFDAPLTPEAAAGVAEEAQRKRARAAERRAREVREAAAAPG
jgi:hypothetical protein